jgi:hypothetical protein
MAGKIILLAVPFNHMGTMDKKPFSISFVSNWATREFEALTRDSLAIWQEANALRTGNKKIEDANNEILERAESLLQRKYDLVQDIIESNGYEFDLKWWDRRTDPNAVNAFLRDCVQKDTADSKKK